MQHFGFRHAKLEDPFLLKACSLQGFDLQSGRRRPKLHLPGKFFRGSWPEYRQALRAMRRDTPEPIGDRDLTLAWRGVLKMIAQQGSATEKTVPEAIVVAVGRDGVSIVELEIGHTDVTPISRAPYAEVEVLLELLFGAPAHEDLPMLALGCDTPLARAIAVVAKERLRASSKGPA